MKKYTLSAMGDIAINSYGDLRVDDVKLSSEFAKSLGLNEERYELKQFAGKVEITITDFTEPLRIDTAECEIEEG